jgi:hypothetical protein
MGMGVRSPSLEHRPQAAQALTIAALRFAELGRRAMNDERKEKGRQLVREMLGEPMLAERASLAFYKYSDAYKLQNSRGE